MDSNAKQERSQIMQAVDTCTHPDKMTPGEAIEFLDELGADIEGRIEALKEENDL